MSAIAQANGISNPNLIQVGQRLSITGGSAPTPSRPVTGPGPVSDSSGTSGGVSPQQLRAIMPDLSQARAEQYLPHLNAAMAEAGINTPRRQAAFLAQLAHESGEFRLENNPTRAADPDVGFRTAAWFWNSRNLNSDADAGNFDAITYRVNGGYTGKASRDACYARALEVLGG